MNWYVKSVVAQRFYDPDAEQEIGYIDDEQLESILEDTYDDAVLSGEMEEATLEQQPDIPIPDKEYPEFSNNIEALNYAQGNKEGVRIYYTTKKGRDLVRDVEPQMQFVARTTGNRIVVTFDRTVGDHRAFIVNNISYYMFLGDNANA